MNQLFFDILLWQCIALIALALLLFFASKVVHKISIIDRFWSIFFIVAFFVAWKKTPGELEHVWLIAVPLFLWAIRLSLHITIKTFGKPEDQRYLDLAKKYSHKIPLWSLWVVFILQAFLALIISLPITVAIMHSDSLLFWPFAIIGQLVFYFGFFFEAAADLQLLLFIRNRKKNEEILTSGLWGLSRHPNYFGEVVVWWGLFLISVSLSGNVLTIVSPLLVTFLLLRISGVTMLDSQLKKTKPKYRDYIKSTNAFFPWPKKNSKT